MFVIADDIGHHEVLLVGSHVEVENSEAEGDQVVYAQAILEGGVDLLGFSDKGEVEHALLCGTGDVVLEVETQPVVHSKGRDGRDHVDPFVGLIVVFFHVEMDLHVQLRGTADVCIRDLYSPCP